MRHAKHIPRSGASLLILMFLISHSFIGCGGGALVPNFAQPPRGATGGNPAALSTANSNVVVLPNLHQKGGWTGYALLRSDNYSICLTCLPVGPEATWDMAQDVASPSVSESSSRFNIGGNEVFSNVLWNNHLIGDLSSQSLRDSNKTLVPSLRNFVYDVYFFGSNLPLSQALEFDVNQFFDGKSFIWGHKCRIAGGNEWDTWNNMRKTWIPSGIACNPKNNEWNHVVIEVQRTADNRLFFQSITLNGDKSAINRYDNPTRGKGWYGVTINYQQDGNRDQAAYSIWLDKLTFTYW